MLTWKTLSSDDVFLCQFMVNYELRQGEYVVALDPDDNIIAAGLLFELTGQQAQVDVVVTLARRQQGIGRQVVEHLIEQAQQRQLTRLVGHSADDFWHCLDFVKAANGEYALLLDTAARDLVETWHQGIPISQFMALDITTHSLNSVTTSSAMTQCINVHHSMFAGAIYSQAVLTGWGLIHLSMARYGLVGSIVLASGKVNYLRPLRHDPQGNVEQLLALADFCCLVDGKKCSINLTVNLTEGGSDQLCATFTGRYVIIPND